MEPQYCQHEDCSEWIYNAQFCSNHKKKPIFRLSKLVPQETVKEETKKEELKEKAKETMCKESGCFVWTTSEYCEAHLHQKVLNREDIALQTCLFASLQDIPSEALLQEKQPIYPFLDMVTKGMILDRINRMENLSEEQGKLEMKLSTQDVSKNLKDICEKINGEQMELLLLFVKLFQDDSRRFKLMMIINQLMMLRRCKPMANQISNDEYTKNCKDASNYQILLLEFL